ncbi:MAG: hypothetical protein BWY78_00657 [Alphaproteobacteria bacterium ADurb.Bin438]|nr:MAG: hypothetical protein BWY78_00657 [Alphaproteobacteria bacterium ADurb.Bin438]
MKKALLLILLMFCFNVSAEEIENQVDEPTPLTKEEEEALLKQQQKEQECALVKDLIKGKKYYFEIPNEELVARKFFFSKIESLAEKYLKKEAKSKKGLYYIDIANNNKPKLLMKVKEEGVCNFAYFVFLDKGDKFKKLVEEKNYFKSENYKMYCHSENEQEIVKMAGKNYIISKNFGGRVNRIDRIEEEKGFYNLFNVCSF